MYCMSDVEIDFSVNTPTVAHESIDGEVIVINLISGNYYSLEGTGAEIWESIDGGYSLPKITALLADRYTTDAVNIAPIIDRFVAELERENLIVARTQDEPARQLEVCESLDDGRKINPQSTAFTPPTINRYSDMQELLLLDPIHDVDAAGWPKTTTV
jgi:hypothetical protein